MRTLKNTIIVTIERLKPLELVFKNHLKNLDAMIKKTGVVESPIIADEKTGIILDGSHRYIFFLANGYKEIPVKFVDYNDEHIRVGSRLIHRHLIEDSTNISKSEVIKRGLSGNLFPPRTTRHFFPFRKNEFMNIKLDDLKKGSSIDVRKYIAETELEEEIQHNRKYLEEIEYEFDELIRYMEEVRQTKLYLKAQICEMTRHKYKVAFFPGKFQPVHLGHVVTLMSIYNDYDRIIVGITQDGPTVLTQEQIRDIFKSSLKYLPKFEIVLIKGSIENSSSLHNLPEFDVCVSGNQKVIDKICNLGKPTRYIERSEGVNFSGTEIRTLLNMDKNNK